MRLIAFGEQEKDNKGALVSFPDFLGSLQADVFMFEILSIPKDIRTLHLVHRQFSLTDIRK